MKRLGDTYRSAVEARRSIPLPIVRQIIDEYESGRLNLNRDVDVDQLSPADPLNPYDDEMWIRDKL